MTTTRIPKEIKQRAEELRRALGEVSLTWDTVEEAYEQCYLDLRPSLEQVREALMVPEDKEIDETDSPICAICGDFVDVGENQWNQGKDACYPCIQTRYYEASKLLNALLENSPLEETDAKR